MLLGLGWRNREKLANFPFEHSFNFLELSAIIKGLTFIIDMISYKLKSFWFCWAREEGESSFLDYIYYLSEELFAALC